MDAAPAKSPLRRAVTIVDVLLATRGSISPRASLFRRIAIPFSPSDICFLSAGPSRELFNWATNSRRPILIGWRSAERSYNFAGSKVPETGGLAPTAVGAKTAAAVPGRSAPVYGLLVPTFPYCCARAG